MSSKPELGKAGMIMPMESAVPESSIWLNWEYSRYLRRTGIPQPRPRGISQEESMRAMKAYAARNPDPGFSEAVSRLERDKKLSALMEGLSEYGFGENLAAHTRALQPALQAYAQHVPPVIVRELATDEYNACAINTISGYLILVDTGVPFFINQCGKVAGYACPEFVKFPGNVDYQPERSPDGAEVMKGDDLLAFCALSLGIQAAKYVRDREPSALSFLSQPQRAKFDVLRDVVIGAERFMIAHEYGHIVRQHMVAQSTGNTVPVRAMEQELEADRFAAGILLTPEVSRADIFGFPAGELSYDSYVQRAIAGMALFCASDYLVEVTKECLNEPEMQAAKTHPSATARWASLKAGLEAKCRDGLEFGDSLFSFFTGIGPVAAHCAVESIESDEGS